MNTTASPSYMKAPDPGTAVSSDEAPENTAAFSMNCLFSEENLLKIIYSKIIGKNKNVLGLDSVSSQAFISRLRDEIDIIRRKTAAGTYSFTRYRLQLISKGPDKAPRKICIPTVRDRVVIALLSEYLKHAFPEETRPLMPNLVINRFLSKRSAHTRFFKLDITTFFGTIDHHLLFRKLREKIHDQMVLDLFQKLVITDSYDPESKKTDKSRSERQYGIPEGLSCSGLLAEIYLADLDRKYSGYPGITFFRYVDDILVLCEPDSFQTVKNAIDQDMADLKLRINHEKDEDGELAGHLQYLGYVFDGPRITVRKSSVLKHEEALEKMFRKYSELLKNPQISVIEKCTLLFEFKAKISLLCSGVKVDEKQLGWLSYYRKINDTRLLHHLDWLVEHFFARFNTEKFPVKRHVRAYYEFSRNIRKSTYIYKIDSMRVHSFSLTDNIAKMHQSFDRALTEINDGQNRDAVVSFILSHPGKFPGLVQDFYNSSAESTGENRKTSTDPDTADTAKEDATPADPDSAIIPEKGSGTPEPAMDSTGSAAADEGNHPAPANSAVSSDSADTGTRTGHDGNTADDTGSTADDAENTVQTSLDTPEIQKILKKFEKGGEITPRDYLLLSKGTDIDLIVRELAGEDSEVSQKQIDAIASSLVIGEMIEDPIIREDLEESGYY